MKRQNVDNSDIDPQRFTVSDISLKTGNRIYLCVKCGQKSHYLQDGKELRQWHDNHMVACSK